MNGVGIHVLTSEMYGQLSKLRGWDETKVASGQAIEAHVHGFNAMYFTNGVKYLYSGGEKIPLPECAAVFVPNGTQHGWSGVAKGRDGGVVGFLEAGHGGHNIVTEY